MVLYSDHGFFQGEKQRWAKQSLWERATRVPFIISAPGLPRGAKCSRPVELLSIYPTLIDLCGIKRRDDLEAHIAHQDSTIDDLNQVILEQWNEIKALTEKMARLEAKVQTSEQAAESDESPEPPPPHY